MNKRDYFQIFQLKIQRQLKTLRVCAFQQPVYMLMRSSLAENRTRHVGFGACKL